ncbi:MAG: hypothetical protein A2018_07105 [Alphaproteobacteria bacterium GWF2_58_20]|nr:MAG: hypothetical protein A2018_07105 [Alphaproteobacteria bacterium GWF2_58_20]
MMRPFPFSLSLLALLCAGAPALAMDPVEMAPLGAWRGRMVLDEQTGAFSYCTIENSFDKGFSTIIAQNGDHETNIAIVFGDPRLALDRKYEIRLDIDGKLQRNVDGFAADSKLLVAPTGNDPEFLKALSTGKTLTFTGSVDAVTFQLGDIRQPISDLTSCVDVSAPKPTKTLENGGDTLLPKPLSVILRAAGLGKAEVVELPGTPENRPIDYAWNFGPILGGAEQITLKPGEDFLKKSMAYIDVLAPLCPGTFSQEVGKPENFGNLHLLEADMACLGGNRETSAALVFYQVGDTLTVFFHEAALPDRAMADNARANIIHVLRYLIKGEGDPLPAPARK